MSIPLISFPAFYGTFLCFLPFLLFFLFFLSNVLTLVYLFTMIADTIQQIYVKNEDAIKKQCLPLSVAATVTFLAYKLYKNRAKQSSIDDSLLPPLVKGTKPIIGNLLDLQKDPAKYLDNAKNTYGPCFRIAIPGQGKLCVVTGPLISEVMKATKNFSFTQGIETLVPAAKVVQISYKHKFVAETISPREKHPSKCLPAPPPHTKHGMINMLQLYILSSTTLRKTKSTSFQNVFKLH